MRYLNVLLFFIVSVQFSCAQTTSKSLTMSSFGAVGDGVTDDTNSFKEALKEATNSGRTLDGENKEYKVSGQIKLSGKNLYLKNIRFKMNDDHTKSMNLTLTMDNVKLENISVNGARSSNLIEEWETFAVENDIQSIRPKTEQIFYIITTSTSSSVDIINLSVKNLHVKTCLLISSFGNVNLDGLYFSNVSNKTFHVFHSRDEGKYQKGQTTATNIKAENVGILPESIKVNGIMYETSEGKYMPQESFNFIVSFGDFKAKNVFVDNYGATALTSDRNINFTCEDVKIHNSSNVGYSNNPSGGLWLEASKNVYGKKIEIAIYGRDSKDLQFDNSAIHIYGKGSVVSLQDISITGADNTVLNKAIRGSLLNDNTVFLENVRLRGRYRSGGIYIANMNTEPTSNVRLKNINTDNNLFFWGISDVTYDSIKGVSRKEKITYLLPHNPKNIGKLIGIKSNLTDVTVSSSVKNVSVKSGRKSISLKRR